MLNKKFIIKLGVFALGFVLLTGCQIVPEEKDGHVFVRRLDDGRYLYNGQIYDAEKLAREVKKRFMAGEEPSKKIEIHCYGTWDMNMMRDHAIFGFIGVKLVSTKDYKYKSECSGTDETIHIVD